ncbi:MAG: hypothetical protein IJ906_05595 [Oscillospiraceae bacterium]|nr:hypothetical protein [Oscillospiraceae bacterium]
MKPMDLMEALGDLPEKNIEKVLTYRPPQKRTAFLVSKPFLAGISTAASLMLIVGLGVGVWSRQQKIETRPPQETQTTTVSETETRTETTAQVTTESQTTGKQTEESTKNPETTANPIQTSFRVQPSESAAALLTTVFQTETAASAAPQTDVAEVGTRQTTTLAASAHTALQQTSVTAGIQQQVVSVTPQTSVTADIATEPPITDVTETTAQTTAAPSQATTAAYTHTGAPTEPPPADYEVLPGFAVTEWNDGKMLRVEWLSPLAPSPKTLVRYHSESERFVLEFAGKVSSQYEYWYDLYDTETGKYIRIRMWERNEFSREFTGGGVLTPAPVNGNPGFQYLDVQRNQCILCWDNGCYQCTIYAAPDEQEILLPAAEALAPESN